jgi:hypothetical protein
MTGPKPAGLSGQLQRDHLISVAQAVAMTSQFRAAAKSEDVRAWLFDRRSVDVILAQPGCAGLRIYRAVGQDGPQVVLVGTDKDGNDLVPAKATDPGLVAERAWPCPPDCGKASILGG